VNILDCKISCDDLLGRTSHNCGIITDTDKYVWITVRVKDASHECKELLLRKSHSAKTR
jgi:hypothetical protein